MNRRPFPPLLLAAALATTVLPAQIHPVRCIVLVHAGIGDIVLNAPLVSSLLDDEACRARLTTALGQAPTSVRWAVDLPVAHQPGTFQVHVEATAYVGGEWTTAREDALIDAVHTHLQTCMDRLLYTEPRDRLRARLEELTTVMTKAAAERRELLARSTAAERARSTLLSQQDALEQQLVATRVDLATEQSAAVRLDQLQATNLKRREELREQLTRAAREIADLQQQLLLFTNKIAQNDAKGSVLETLRADAQKLEAAVRQRRDEQGRVEDQLQDAQRLLTVVLEQMPTIAIATHRAEARLQSLMDEQRRLAERGAEVEQRARQAADAALAADRLGGEIAAAEAQLAIVRSKLAQLEPVRCEVLRSR